MVGFGGCTCRQRTAVGGLVSPFECIGSHHIFQLTLYHEQPLEEDIIGFDNDPLLVRILEVSPCDPPPETGQSALLITFEMVEPYPPGIQPGTYTLRFANGECCGFPHILKDEEADEDAVAALIARN